MGLSSALFSGISGLSTMGNAMGVLGDNVSNVNTIAFKSSRATFQDVLSQSVSTAAGTAQVGRGVTLSTVDGLFAQGSFESTSTATDLAIGGSGFFMLRAPDSAQADKYTRAGEFRFDQQGNLVSPVGQFVQGWTIDSTTGEVSGTVGDINLGKSTPPVATDRIELITNLDSRKSNETNEIRLFNAWNGTNAAAANPTDPIDSANFEYTSAIKIFDSKGASHDITIYFDRTTTDNQWEYLVTCDPAEDKRVLTTKEQTIYAPDTTYNYKVHKGAGALMYGLVDFSTQGDITNIEAWNVPPDGEVDPALNVNRMVLGTTDKYYKFPSNFTGATTNQQIELNFGARYGGLSSNQAQILASDSGAFANLGLTDYITKETLWNTVYDSNGNQMSAGDTFFFSGYQHDGTAVSGRYTVKGTDKVQALLTQIGNTFGGTATVDAYGRIKLTDNNGGDSGMYVTTFTTSSTNDATPFGGTALAGTHAVVSGGAATNYIASNATGTAATDPTAVLTTLFDDAGNPFLAGNYTFSGQRVSDGAAIGPTAFAVTAGTTTVQDMLNFLEDFYDDGTVNSSYTNGTVTASLGGDGRIRIVDNTGSTNLAVTLVSDPGAGDPLGADGSVFAAQTVYNTQVNITTSKREVVSPGRALTTNTGLPPVVSATTTWDTVYQASSPYTQVANGDTIVFSGTKGDGTPVSATTYTINTTNNSTVQDFLDTLETAFDADASIDGAGRLRLRDRTADSSTSTSALAFTITGASTAPDIFGDPANWSTITIPGDLSEDGSQQGDVVTTGFETEALASTQYANSSTTIFQDQDGFAAGFLQSVSVDTKGVITGHYSNGQVLKKAQVTLANFNNLAGLRKEGGNIYTETTDSGAPVTGAPGTNGLGSIAPNSLEQSNVDLGNEFVKLITTQRGFQANSKVITTTDQMLNDLINIKR